VSGRNERERAMAKRFGADEREAFEHLAARLEYDAADVYSSREAAEEAAFYMVIDEMTERALRASVRRAESIPPPDRGAND
jgi:hypothetical protein